MLGIDISHHQGTVNFSQVKESGKEFVIAKINQAKHVDVNWETYYTNGHNLLPFGGYIYNKFLTNAEAEAEALTCIKAIRGKNLPCGVWLDMEDKSMRQLSKMKLAELIDIEANLIKSAGFNVGIYCNKDWFYNVLDGANLRRKYPFWIARYPKDDNGTIKESLSPSLYADIWQYSSKGSVNGINGNVDLDISYKTFADIFKKFPVNATYPTLKKGSKGEYVTMLQRMLNSRGYYLVEDGKFGPNTFNAVVSFQAEKNLVNDGIVGRKTWNALLN